MSKHTTTCIYVSDPKKKEQAQRLAELHGKSFSDFVWGLLDKELERNKDVLKKFEELMIVEKAIRPAERKRPGIANWRQDVFTLA